MRVDRGHPGGPSPHLFFNMVVDYVIQNWVVIVVGEEDRPDGFRRYVQWIKAFFYEDNGILASLQLSRLHSALDVLTGLFGRVILQNNFKNMVGIVCQHYLMDGGHLESAYRRQVTGVGPP